MNLSVSDWFRHGTTIFAGMLGISAVWMLSVELIRPSLPYFPDDRAAVEAAAAHRSAAGVAASIGLIRGDLWADYAITLAPAMSGEIRGAIASTAPEALDVARAAAVRAAELAPHDARAWLLLAAMDARLDFLNHKVAGPLKMSYYTGPNEIALIPLRILIATRSDAITDGDLQVLVGGEIRTIITRKPESKPLILAAYRDALPEGKSFIEAAVADFDPALLAAMRATGQPR
jgi:hypothetical protein